MLEGKGAMFRGPVHAPQLLQSVPPLRVGVCCELHYWPDKHEHVEAEEEPGDDLELDAQTSVRPCFLRVALADETLEVFLGAGGFRFRFSLLGFRFSLLGFRFSLLGFRFSLPRSWRHPCVTDVNRSQLDDAHRLTRIA